MVGVLIRMKLRMLRHSLRGRRAVGLVIGGLFGLVAGVVTALLASVDFGDPEASTDIVAALLAAWTLGWLAAPVLTGGSDETLQPEHFRLLPIPPRRLASGFLAVSLVGPAPLVGPPEVVLDHSPDLGCQSVQRISESRPDHITGPAQGRWGGSGRAGHAGTASGTVRACPNQPRACAAAAVPERTAPSMVAGQPVSVHAPARYRPGMPVTGPGRRARVPGA